jgi:hypothetical protein
VGYLANLDRFFIRKDELNAIRDIQAILQEEIPRLSETKAVHGIRIIKSPYFGLIVRDGHIIELGLENKSLVELPDSIGALARLENLMVAQNQLKSLPTTLLQSNNLRIVDVEGNGEEIYADEVFLELTTRIDAKSRESLPEDARRRIELDAVRFADEYVDQLMHDFVRRHYLQYEGIGVLFDMRSLEAINYDFYYEPAARYIMTVIDPQRIRDCLVIYGDFNAQDQFYCIGFFGPNLDRDYIKEAVKQNPAPFLMDYFAETETLRNAKLVAVSYVNLDGVYLRGINGFEVDPEWESSWSEVVLKSTNDLREHAATPFFKYICS